MVLKTDSYIRMTHLFDCSGLSCEGWLFLPSPSAEVVDMPPVVVMAHGMGSQKDFGLDAFYEPIVESGIAVFVFDYRTFGGSEGETQYRNYVCGKCHVEDYHSALAHVRTLSGTVDTSKIGLWGTSFSGGHVLVTAAKDHDIVCVVSQVPYLKYKPNALQYGATYMLSMVSITLRDVARSLFGLPPFMVQFVGDAAAGELAILGTPDSKAYLKKVGPHPRGGWQNKIWGRLGAEILFYTPLDHLKKVDAPVLMVAARRDSLCPWETILTAQSLVSNIDLYSDDVGHFDYYRGGPGYERALDAELKFLKQHLLPNSLPVSKIRGVQ